MREGSLDSESLERVCSAGSEMEALAVLAALEDEGIEAAVRSRQIPMWDGIAQALDPVWGWVLVRSSDLERASGVLREFRESLESLPEGEGDGE
jgi:hypothetical protein